MKTWIDEFTDIVSGYSDVPYQAIRAAGYWVISSTLGTQFVIKETPRPLRPNIFVLISGPGGLIRKSTVIDYAKTVFVSAWENFYDSIGIQDYNIDDKIIEEFTIEGLTDHIDSVSDKTKDFVLMTDEFGVWLHRSKQRHLTGERGLLSKLYYGETYKQYLSKRGGDKGIRRIPPGLYFTMIAAMQDADLYLTEIEVRQGLVRRLMVINLEVEDKKTFKPPLSRDRSDVYDKLIDLGRKIGDKMTYIYDNFIVDYNKDYKIDIFFSNDIIDAINKFSESCEKLAINKYKDSPGICGYLTSCWEYIMKLTVLESLADPINMPKNVAGEPLFNVGDIEYFKKSNDFYEEIKSRTVTMITDVSVEKSKEPVRIAKDVYQKILNVIDKRGGIATASELLLYTHLKKSDLKEYVVTLVEQGKVTVIAEKVKGSRGSSTKFIFFTRDDVLKDYIVKNPNAKIIPYTTLRDIW